jgi:hypothetical protein
MIIHDRMQNHPPMGKLSPHADGAFSTLESFQVTGMAYKRNGQDYFLSYHPKFYKTISKALPKTGQDVGISSSEDEKWEGEIFCAAIGRSSSLRNPPEIPALWFLPFFPKK